jgi:hypothetical protein
VLEYRQLTKLRSTYVDALPALVNPRTGRVHTSFNQTGTATGRLSSSDPNLQNIPAKTTAIREAFVCPDGYIMVFIDYSQIEVRMTAHYSQDPILLDCYNVTHRDVHTNTMSEVFGYGYDDAIYAGARLLEILTTENKELEELLAGVPSLVSTPEIRMDCPDDQKFRIVADLASEFKKEYQVIEGSHVADFNVRTGQRGTKYGTPYLTTGKPLRN